MAKTVDVSLDGVDDWFKDELFTLFSTLVQSVAGVVSDTAAEIELLVASGLDESFIERSARDIKATGLDSIEKLLSDLLT